MLDRLDCIALLKEAGMPDEVLGKWLANAMTHNTPPMRSKYGVISDAFVWGATPEGWGYWDMWDTKYRKNTQ